MTVIDIPPFPGVLRPIYNVKDYGARGDGLTDDTAAINAAIAATPSGGGGTIFFPATVNGYVISSTITLKSDVRLLGEGTDSTSIRSTADIHFITIPANATRCIVERLTINPNNAAFSKSGIRIIGGTSITGYHRFIDLEIINTSGAPGNGTGFFLDANTNATNVARNWFVRCYVQDLSIGYLLQANGTTSSVNSNTFLDCWAVTCIMGCKLDTNQASPNGIGSNIFHAFLMESGASTTHGFWANGTGNVSNNVFDNCQIIDLPGGGLWGLFAAVTTQNMFISPHPNNKVTDNGTNVHTLTYDFPTAKTAVFVGNIEASWWDSAGAFNMTQPLYVATGSQTVLRSTTQFLMATDGSGNLGFYHLLYTYNGVTTRGYGLPVIYGLDNRSGITAADGAPITLYSVPAGANQLFDAAIEIDATVFTSGTATYTMTYTENGVAQTIVVTATALNVVTGVRRLIQPDPSTLITVQLTGAFVATVRLSAAVMQLA